MSIHYILGGPGTGKTTKIINTLIESAIQNPEQRHIMLVPEQYTMQTQRDIIRMHPNHAVMNIDILSFERLAYRVMEEVGQEHTAILTNMGKNMMLRRIAEEHKDELTIFTRSLKKPGFINRLMTIMSEFYQYGIDDEKLNEILQKTAERPLLNRKLQDLQIFYNAMNLDKGEDTIAAEELLSLLLRLLPLSDFLKNTVVAMDYFTGFTPIQYRIIRRILEESTQVYLALCLPEEEWSEESREEDLFHMSRCAIYQCDKMAGEIGQDRSAEYLRENYRHRQHKDLAYLTAHLMRYHGTCSTDPVTDIQAICWRNPRQEAEYAADEIRRLVMEEGLRYREIAVVTGDIEEYRPYLQHAFEHLHIPAYMDRKKGVLGNPMVEFIRSGIGVITNDFSYDSVFRFLRCGIPMMEREEVDALDLYCLAKHVHGRKAYEKEWTAEEDSADLDCLNETRAKLMHILAPLTETRNLFVREMEGKHRISVSDRTQVLRQMLEANQIKDVMEAMKCHVEESAYTDLIDEYRLIYEFIQNLLDEMDKLLGEQTMSLQEFSDILEAGLSEAKLGVMPSTLDVVQVGDVMRSRLSDIKALIVIGFNDGVIPGGRVSGGILSEQERMVLESLDMELAPAAEHVMNQERFYLYRLLTRPSDHILITCSRMGMDGSARRVSYLWNQLSGLFPELTMIDGDNMTQVPIRSVDQAWTYFAEHIQELKRQPNAELESVGEFLRDRCPEQMQQLIEAAFVRKKTDSISEAVASVLYGENLRASVTRLEKYAACAYAHFLTYGLRLAERDDGTFTGANRGDFFHRTLELFFRLCRERKIDYISLSPEERSALVKEAAKQASFERGVTEIEDSSANGYLKQRWSKLADRTVWAICSMLEEEDFVPAFFEMHFDGDRTKAMSLPLDGDRQMILHGIVDRLDVYDDGDHQYLRVVDYKTGSVRLDLNQIYQGHQLQLPMYLNAVMENAQQRNRDKEIIPGGICYYHLDDPLIDCEETAQDEMIQGEILKALRMNGFTLKDLGDDGHLAETTGEKLTADQFRWICSHVRKKAGEFGQDIVKGRIQAEPYRYKSKTGCDYCGFSGICGFNPRRKGYTYHMEKEVKKKDLWVQLEEEHDGSTMDD